MEFNFQEIKINKNILFFFHIIFYYNNDANIFIAIKEIKFNYVGFVEDDLPRFSIESK